MTGAWRELLAEHEPDEHARCRACSPWWLRCRAHCTVWRTAHRHLIADAAERCVLDGAYTGRHRFRQGGDTGVLTGGQAGASGCPESPTEKVTE